MFQEVKDEEKVKSTFPMSDTWVNVEERGKGIGETKVKIKRGLFETAAYFWDFESRAQEKTTGDVERVAEEILWGLSWNAVVNASNAVR